MLAFLKAQVLAFLITVALVTFMGATASACIPQASDARVEVSLAAGSDLTTLTQWAKAQTCIDYRFASAIAERRLAQEVRLAVVGRDVATLFELLLHTLNLRVTGTGTKRIISPIDPAVQEPKANKVPKQPNPELERVFARIDRELTEQDETHHTISRRGLDATWSHLQALSRTLRLLPELKNGHLIGFRLSSVRSNSLPARIGFREGDVIQAVNGIDLTTPDFALQNFAQIRSADLIRFSILRKEKPVHLELSVK